MKKWKGLVNKTVPITHQLPENDTEGEKKIKLEQQEQLKKTATEGTTSTNMPRRFRPMAGHNSSRNKHRLQ